MVNNSTNTLHDYLKSFFPEMTSDEKGIALKYTDKVKEFSTMRYGVGIRDASHSGLLKLEGKDSVDFIQRISTNDVGILSVNEKDNTLFTNERGKLIGRSTFVKFADYSFLLTSASNKKRINYWIERYLTSEDVTISDLAEKYSVLEFYGKQAESYLTLLFGKKIDLLTDRNVLEVSLEAFRGTIIKAQFRGVRRFILFFDTIFVKSIIDAIMNEKSIFDVDFIGEEAFEVFRIEKGLPKGGSEITDEYYPDEVNLSTEVNPAKASFIGKSEMLAGNSEKRLCGIVCDSNLLANGTKPELFDDSGNSVGKVTSITESFKLGSYVGLAVVDTIGLKEGRKFHAKQGPGNVDVKIIELKETK